MDCRVVILIGAVGAAALVSCSGPNPAAIKFEDRDPSDPVAAPTGTSTPGGDTPGGSTPGTDGGGGTNPGTTGDIVFGNSTFNYVAPTKVANEVTNHGGSVAGKNCITGGCHLDNSHKWVFAGTVFTAADGATPVTKAEVRVVTGDGVLIGSAYTDSGGNFWFAGPGQLAQGSRVGVRTESGASAIMSMALAATDKGCNATTGNCHGTTAQGKVHVP